MPAVYHGKLKLWWCDECNLPLLTKKCEICHSLGRKIKITPPGDVRPAFAGDLKIINSLLEDRYGIDEGLRGVVLLNRLPAEDLAYEIIYCGKIIGILRYNGNFFDISLKPDGAEIFRKSIKKGYVVADDGAEDSLLSGRNLMAPGVVDIADNVRKGMYVVVLCRDSVGVGISKIDANNVPKKGVAVKMKGFKKIEDVNICKNVGWEDVLRANEKHLENLEKEAIEFIKRTAKEISLPILVSFSGGKDSMATLLLVMKSGLKYESFFLDTGIELEETLRYVDDVEKRYGLKIKRIHSDDRFWKSLEKYGPPARDYRWCCKVVKLGPTTKFIMENYPNGVLTFVGQRRYESDVRSKTPRIWRNKWVPNQIAASPIQDWTALEVFLYLMKEKAPLNPWYERGMNRIGCYLCPSSDLGDFKIMEKYSKILEKWFEYLEKYARENDFPDYWISLGLWRWVNIPKRFGIKDIPEKRRIFSVRKKVENGKVKFIPNRKINMERLKNLSFVLPEDCIDLENLMSTKDCAENFLKIIYKVEECVGCGICLAHCMFEALYIKNDMVWVNKQKCTKCMKCLEAMCPAVSWR